MPILEYLSNVGVLLQCVSRIKIDLTTIKTILLNLMVWYFNDHDVNELSQQVKRCKIEFDIYIK